MNAGGYSYAGRLRYGDFVPERKNAGTLQVRGCWNIQYMAVPVGPVGHVCPLVRFGPPRHCDKGLTPVTATKLW